LTLSAQESLKQHLLQTDLSTTPDRFEQQQLLVLQAEGWLMNHEQEQRRLRRPKG
jgi:hypothetical protein